MQRHVSQAWEGEGGETTRPGDTGVSTGLRTSGSACGSRQPGERVRRSFSRVFPITGALWQVPMGWRWGVSFAGFVLLWVAVCGHLP